MNHSPILALWFPGTLELAALGAAVLVMFHRRIPRLVRGLTTGVSGFFRAVQTELDAPDRGAIDAKRASTDLTKSS
jgi:Sec-independent protein translocase protein TatA